MWQVIPSLVGVLQPLAVVFTEPSFLSHQQVFVGWIMCLGTRTEFQVFEAIDGRQASRQRRHPFDSFYNFFNRSAWELSVLACSIAVQVVLRFYPKGEIPIVVDGTLLLKQGKHVYLAGWFYDGNSSTKKRLATGRGNKWVVIGILVPIPGANRKMCLPIHARLQPPGKNVSSEAQIADQLLIEILAWFPDRVFLLVADGGFSSAKLLNGLNDRIRYVGLLRSNAAIHAQLKESKKMKRGRPAQKGKRLPSPTSILKTADKSGTRKKRSQWTWKTITARGIKYKVCSFHATWPRVTKNRLVQIVICRPLRKGYNDLCLFTTDTEAMPKWVIETYAKRSAIEAVFRSSKQVFQIQKPKHWSRTTVEKLAPWVWLAQTTVAIWYLTDGQRTPEARAARRRMGRWETEWSYEFMVRLLRQLTTKETFNVTIASKSELKKICEAFENYVYLAS